MTTFSLQMLLDKNKQYTAAYEKNALMQLIKADAQMQNEHQRTRLLDCIQVFSNYFQKTVMLRAILTDHDEFLAIAQEHLHEEFGHDLSLMQDRQHRHPQWDPVLEACSAWFAWKMLTLDNHEKTLLVHLVLEASAHLFFQEAHRVMQQYGGTDYFEIHAELDEHHESMGMDLLEGLREKDYKQLSVIQAHGWDMLNTVCDRIAVLVKHQL